MHRLLCMFVIMIASTLAKTDIVLSHIFKDADKIWI